MRTSRLLPGLLLGVLLGTTAAFAQSAPKPTSRTDMPTHTASGVPIREWVDGVPDTGQFLADTTTLAIVGGERITVLDYRSSYFDVYAPLRSSSDSSGRVEFLNTLIDKRVLAEVVRPLPFTPGFEKRAALREYRTRVLGNVLFQRAVLDSCNPSETDIRDFYNQLKQEVHVQRIRVSSPKVGERVRGELLAGRTSWRKAVAEYSQERPADADGDMGWLNVFNLQEPLASELANLKIGGVSAPMHTTEGFFLFRRVGSRPFNPPPFEAVAKTLSLRLRNHLITERAQILQEQLIAASKLQLDSANVQWAAAQYSPHMTSERKPGGVEAVTLNVDVPHFELADDKRVLARWDGGELTLGDFNHALSAMNPLNRPAIHEFELLGEQVALQALEPHRADLAVKLGLEQDSMAVAMLEARVGQFKAEAMIEDSVMRRVQVSDAERRAYYQENPRQFTSYPKVRFAVFSSDTRTTADSLAAVLKSGTSPFEILRADSLAGIRRGSVQTRTRNEQFPYSKLLFEGMRPGQISVEGPLADQTFLVMNLLEFDPGQLLPYDEVKEFADNHVRSLAEERAYQQFMQRQRSRVETMARYDLLSRVKLVAPEL